MTVRPELGRCDLELYEDLLATGCPRDQAAALAVRAFLLAAESPEAEYSAARVRGLVAIAMRLRLFAVATAGPPRLTPEWMEPAIALLWRHAGESEPAGRYRVVEHDDDTYTLTAIAGGHHVDVRTRLPVRLMRRAFAIMAKAADDPSSDREVLEVVEDALDLARECAEGGDR